MKLKSLVRATPVQLSMRIRTFSVPAIGLSFLVGLSAQGASSLSYNFEGEALSSLFAGGVTGWTQDSPNPTAFDSTIFPLAYIATTNFGAGGTNAGHLGTQFANTADNSSTTLLGTLNFAGIDQAAPQVSLNLAILDNSNDSFSGRDGFGVAVKSTTGSILAELGFTPTAGLGNEASWDVTVGINGAPVSSTTASINALSGYIFKVSFGSAATSFLFGDSQGGVADVQFASLGPIGVSNMGGIAITHNPLAPAGESATTLAFDNIVASIPEPSGVALLLLGSTCLLGRRRA